MIRRTLTRRTALQDVVGQHLRPSSRVPSYSSILTLNSPNCTRAASSTTDPSHSSLSTFLSYAKRTNLDRASTTFAGTHYEYATQSLLRRYGFDLTRVGGRGDRGVDLKGTWRIATSAQKAEVELPVMVQCKRLKSKVGPNLIRELEGALAGRVNTLGVLVGTKGATKGVRDAMGRSRLGICWVMLQAGDMEENEEVEGKEEDGEEEEAGQEQEREQGFSGILQTMKDEIVSKAPSAVQELLESSNNKPADGHAEGMPGQLGRVRQMLWNRAASNMGLEGLDVVMKYDGTRDESGEVGKEVVLMWQGKSVRELAERKSD